MYIRMKRRRFGRLALGSAATVAIANLPKKVFAQSKQILYGVAAENKDGSLVLYSFDLATGKVQNLGPQSTSINSQERLASFTVSSDNSLTFVTGNRTSVSGKNPTTRNRLIFSSVTSAKREVVPEVTGVTDASVIESLVSKKDGRLLGIVSLNQGAPPFRLANVNALTGKASVISDVELPANRRFSNLIECGDGSIYATSMGSEGNPSLVQIDRVQKSIVSGKSRLIYLLPLTFNRKPLENDLSGLACSPSNQIFALADPAYEGVNSLFQVDLKTGALKYISKFPVHKIAFSKA